MYENVLMNKGGIAELVFERIYDAPKELLWNAWSVPEHVMTWWGPMGYSSPAAKTDFWVGGKYLWAMSGPPGVAWNAGVYKEIVPMERIVFSQSFTDEEGNIVPASRYGMPSDWPKEVLITVTFKEMDGKTKLTIREAGIPEEMRQLASAGMMQSLDKLEKRLVAMPREGELFIERVFDAPRELVWRAWSDAKELVRWWGPKNYSSPEARINFWVGEKFFFSMRSPEGRDTWNAGVYNEIIPLERIISTVSFADSQGNIVPGTTYGEIFSDFPMELTLIVSFEELGYRTKMTLRYAGLPQGKMTELTKAGWNESFDKLAEILETDLNNTVLISERWKQEIIIMRVFDAPRKQIYAAYTDPNLIPLWWGPRRLTTTIEKLDARKGGIWQFRQSDSYGKNYVFNGVYHELKSPERIVQTFEFEDMPGHDVLETVSFHELSGKTLVVEKSVFQSVSDRDMMLNSGMAFGAHETMDRLAELLEKQKSGKHEYNPYP